MWDIPVERKEMSEQPNLPPPPPPPTLHPPPPPVPPLPSIANPEVPVVVEQLQDQDDDEDLEAAAVDVPLPVPPLIGHGAPAHINAHPINLDWPVMVAGFCFQSAVTIAAQSLQTDHDIKLPNAFHMMCLAMVVAVAALCVSMYISAKSPTGARALEHVGVLSGVTAFLIAVTVSSPPFLKLTSWIIFALSIAAILVFNCR